MAMHDCVGSEKIADVKSAERVRKQKLILLAILLTGCLLVNQFEIIGLGILSVCIVLWLLMKRFSISVAFRTNRLLLWFMAFLLVQYSLIAIRNEVSSAIIRNSFLNSIFLCLLLYCGLCLGQDTKINHHGLYIIITAIAVNAILNVYSWIDQANGVFGRYNFVSIVTNNVTGNLYVMIYGFFLSAALIKNRKIKIGLLVLFALNFIIVMGRFYLLLFLGLLVVYYSIKGRDSRLETYIFRFLCILFTILFLLIVMWPFLSKSSLIAGLVNKYVPYFTVFFDGNSRSRYARTLTHEGAMEMFWRYPLFGVGYGLFGQYNTVEYSGMNLASAHSGFYDSISEMGLIGSLLFLGLFLYILRLSFTVIFRKTDNTLVNKACAMLLAAMIVFIYWLHNAFFPPSGQRIYYFHSFIVWYVLGYLESTFLQGGKDLQRQHIQEPFCYFNRQ